MLIILLKYLPVWVYWKNKDGIYLGCNEAFARLHNKDNIEGIVNKTDHELYQSNTIKELSDSDQKTIHCKQNSVSEEKLKTLNNKKIDVLTYRVPIFREGKLIFLLCVSIDITQLIKQQNNLRDVFENIMAILPEHVYWKDANGIILGCNDQQARSVGLQSHLDMIGKTPYDTLPQEQAEAVHAADMEIIKTGVAKTVVEESSKHDGSIAIYESRKAPLFDSETKEISGLVGISFDITERVQAQEREKIAIQKK